MIILTTPTWDEYELIDSGEGRRLERFGRYVLSRPDPQAIWKPTLGKDAWEKADAVFDTTEKREGWNIKTKIPDKWLVHYNDLTFWAKLTPFKHTGIFPEQASHWDWMSDLIKKADHQANILNLFAYTGGATLVAAQAGAKVTHVDASRPSITWARENQFASGLQDKPIRWILDDAIAFARREQKRGVCYDGIVMDPPIYGHGPNGERWDFFKEFPILLDLCKSILSPKPIFFLVNAYAISSSALMLENILSDVFGKKGGTIESGELALKETSGRLLSTGIFARWNN